MLKSVTEELVRTFSWFLGASIEWRQSGKPGNPPADAFEAHVVAHDYHTIGTS